AGAAGGGFREYPLPPDLAQRPRRRLEAAGLSVRLTREDNLPLTPLLQPGNTDDIRAEQEARIAAGMPARVYVSLHFNGGPAALRGTQAHYNSDRDAAAWLLSRALHPPLRASPGAGDRRLRRD